MVPTKAPVTATIYSVAVEYLPTSTSYHFKADIPGLEPGDLVVVKDRHGYNIARVAKIYETPGPQAKAWIVDKVDLSREAMRNRRTELESKLRAELKNQDLIAQAKKVADSNPLIASYVEELEALVNGA